MNFDEKDDSAILEKCHNAEKSNTLSEEVTLDVQEDPCYEVLWRQLEEELKKKDVEERIDAGKFSHSNYIYWLVAQNSSGEIFC